MRRLIYCAKWNSLRGDRIPDASAPWIRVGLPGGAWAICVCDDPEAPVPAGWQEASRDDRLPVSAAEIEQQVEQLKRLGYDDAADLVDEDYVRSVRHDPATEWYAWVAPLDLLSDIEEAGRIYAHAMLSVGSHLTEVCVRPHEDRRHWLAWVGIGSRMEAVIDARRASASFETAEEAESAALAILRPRRKAFERDLRTRLAGWADEAIQRILTGRVPVVAGVWPYAPEPRVRVADRRDTDLWSVTPRPPADDLPDVPATVERVAWRGRLWTRPQLRRFRRYCRMKGQGDTERARAFRESAQQIDRLLGEAES